MELRTAKTIGCLILLTASASALEYPVRHKRLMRDCGGRLRFEVARIVYEGLCGKGKPQTPIEWSYGDAQKLELYPARVVLHGYKDRKWLAGADEVYDFRLEGPVDAPALYLFLRERMDRRLVARLPYGEGEPQWRMPAKELAFPEGAQGELIAYAWGLVFSSEKPGASRTWRDGDLGAIALADPLLITVNTLEGEFVFQLKREMTQQQYRSLWMRLNRPRGLELISKGKD